MRKAICSHRVSEKNDHVKAGGCIHGIANGRVLPTPSSCARFIQRQQQPFNQRLPHLLLRLFNRHSTQSTDQAALYHCHLPRHLVKAHIHCMHTRARVLCLTPCFSFRHFAVGKIDCQSRRPWWPSRACSSPPQRAHAPTACPSCTITPPYPLRRSRRLTCALQSKKPQIRHPSFGLPPIKSRVGSIARRGESLDADLMRPRSWLLTQRVFTVNAPRARIHTFDSFFMSVGLFASTIGKYLGEG